MFTFSRGKTENTDDYVKYQHGFKSVNSGIPWFLVIQNISYKLTKINQRNTCGITDNILFECTTFVWESLLWMLTNIFQNILKVVIQLLCTLYKHIIAFIVQLFYFKFCISKYISFSSKNTELLLKIIILVSRILKLLCFYIWKCTY